MAPSFLGIDVASSSWAANGSALISLDDEGRWSSVQPGAIVWPTMALSVAALAKAIDVFAREHGVAAVALDGPQGWRDPSTPSALPGVGRRCEYECRTQGKTGAYPLTYPRTQRPWIEFCIALFDALLHKPGVTLARPGSTQPPGPGYMVLECFPTSTWRSSGLRPLPGKAKFDLTPYISALIRAYALPNFTTTSHDDLQAVVAALVAVGTGAGPAIAMPRGVAESTFIDVSGVAHRVEGLIWDAQPVGATPPVAQPSPASPSARRADGPTFYVTRQVLEHVNRSGNPRQAQITFKGMPGGTRAAPRRVTLRIGADEYALVVGDSHAIWPSHQNNETSDAFERLFALLADLPDQALAAIVV